MSKKNSYQSDVVLGRKYIDEQTSFEGVATAIYFYQFGCERVTLESYDATQKQIRTETFDAPRLTDLESGVKAKVTRTGGPDKSVNAVRGTPSRP